MTRVRGNPPLSSAQRRLWFLDQLEPGGAEYLVPLAWMLTGPLDVGALRSALATVVDRHESLRTAYRLEDDEPVQVVSARIPVDLPVVEPGGPLADALRGFVERPFELHRAPLWRAVLLRTGPRDHCFLIVLHHSVFDGWSAENLAAELGACYDAELAGVPPVLPELTAQYADFAEAERDLLRGEVLAGHLDYWRTTLAGLTPLELSADRPRTAGQSTRGAAVEFTVPEALLTGLRGLARDQRTTLFMVLVAAVQVLLSRHSGQRDLAIGTPIANRPGAEFEPLIGYFVNTLVLRTDLTGDPAFTDLLARVREASLNAYEHHELPFERLVEELQPDRALGGQPLVRATMALNTFSDELTLSGLSVALHPVNYLHSKFDLTLFLTDHGTSLSASLSYSTDLFDADRMERMSRQLLTLLAAATAEPGARISELALIPEPERRLLTHEWNATAAPVPAGGTLHGLFGEQALATPDAVAVDPGDGTAGVSYAELNLRANRLAHRLRQAGAGAEDVIGVCLPRSVEQLVCLLAVLKAGATYLPLDPDLPAGRLEFVLADTTPHSVLGGTGTAELLPSVADRVLRLDGIDWAGLPEHDPDVPVHPEQIAYVMYTSGSTGRAKGVLTPHRAAAAHLSFLRAEYQLDRRDRVLALAGAGFDASIRETFGALVSGARLVLTGTRPGLDPAAVVRALADHRITAVLSIVPSLLYELAAVSPSPVHPADIRLVLCSGERLRPERFADCEWLRDKVINQFGPTETTMTTTRAPAAAATPAAYLVGRPVANSQAYVLDEAMSLCPVGVHGELYVGGLGVARGYLARPGLTAERFLPNPFGPGRLYRTGDVCRWTADGRLEHVGRVDHQVKVRGFRVEPGEIETRLRACTGVSDAVVVADQDDAGDQRLVAYVVAGDQPVPVLRRWLEQALPAYLIPAVFVPLPVLPRTPNGKVDRHALPAPDSSRPDLAQRATAARTERERTVARVWAEVLGLDEVGVFDNFFDLGGHSLLATRVMSRLSRESGIEVPLRALFENPTVAALAARADTRDRSSAPRIGPAARTGELPLSFAQQRLWFLDQLEPGSPEYVVSGAWRLSGPLDLSALHAALALVVRRHEILRTRFTSSRGRPAQVIMDQVPVELPVHDFDPELLHRLETAPFDLEQAPLWRMAVLRVSTMESVVVLALHHSVADAWSAGVLVRELGAGYRAALAGESPVLGELSVQYADFAVWQREWLSGAVLERQLAYWRGALAGLAPLELPTDRPRAAVRSTEGAAVDFALSGSVAEAVRVLARERGVTVFMVLLAGLQVVLSRYSGQRDVAVGTPIANRNRPEIEPLVGFFVNTLVLRTDLSGDPVFTELLARVRETTLGAYEHQDLPFERLVEELAPERDLARTPLFQVLLSVDNTGGAGWELPGIDAEDYPLPSTQAKFDLTVACTETATGIEGTIRYSTALFDPDRIQRMSAHLCTLLTAATAAPHTALSDLALLTVDEHRRIVHERNATATPLPGDPGVHRLIEDWVRACPELVAVTDEDGTRLTYRELDERANRLAHRLRGMGIGPERLVGVCLPRSADSVVALLAVLKSGGAYLPLDPGQPAERLRFMLDDTGTRVVLTADRTDAAIPGDGPWRRLNLDHEALDLPAPPGPVAVTPSGRLAYVIYTSGSTGLPKGVQIVHGGLNNYLRWALAAYPFQRDGGALLHSPLIFDMTVTSVFLPLLAGRTVHVVGESAGPADLLAATARSGASLLKLTPAHLRLLTEATEDTTEDATGPGGLILGGEDLPAALAARAFAALPGLEYLTNEYGPTEAVVGCAAHTLRPAQPVEGASVPIGRPIANTRLYVLDPDLALCPEGIAGELYIGGAGVARGYAGRPGLTAERFVPDPFTPGRLYRTGDVVRWSAAGHLEYLGRADHQLKVRGYRIEPGEIESRLLAHPDLTDAVVIAREDVPGDRRLVAYVVAPEREPDTTELRDWLAHTLPAYLVPALFRTLPRLPLAASGKVDRAALPAPDSARPELATGPVPPRSEPERAIADVWCRVLGLDEVGVFDNFFDLGGHSLLATQVVSRLVQDHGFELSLRLLFEAPTVAELAARAGRAGPAAGIPLADRRAELALSFAQQRLWFLDQLEPGSVEYVVPLAWRLTGTLDVAALRAAIEGVVARHEVLRTALVTTEGRARQVVSAAVAVELPVLDADPARAHEVVTGLVNRPFDLSEAPLWRVALVRVREGEHVLLWVLHHSVADAWSAGVLVRELGAGYRAALAGESPVLGELSVQYADFAVWQREWLSGAVLERQLAYWRATLTGLAPLELPTDRPRAAVRSTEGAAVDFTLPGPVAEAVRVLAREHGVTVFMVLLAGLQVVLSRYSGQRDVAVGTPIANRNRPEIEPLVGFFVNTLVLRTDLSGDPMFTELLARVREITLGAYEHQDLPFERLVDELAPERDLARTPLFQVLLSMDNTDSTGGAAWDLPGIRTEDYPLPTTRAKFDLTVACTETQDTIEGTIRYSAALFDPDRIQRMAGHLCTLLDSATSNPHTPLSELTLLTPAEHRLIDTGRGGALRFPPGATIHELVERHARARPERIAVTDEHGTGLTYRELDERANRLAHRLRELGAGTDVPVGVSLPRSVGTVVALLAVLKSGGAYLPLDPDYPAERTAFMLTDAGAPVLITDGDAPEGYRGHTVGLDRLDGYPAGNPAAGAAPGDLAYVIYTSGSTGTPKGVLTTHHNAVRLFESTEDYFGFGPEDVWLSSHSYAFDFSVWEIWGALTRGGQVVLARAAVARDPHGLARVIRDRGVTMLSQTPTAFHGLLAPLLEAEPAALRCVVFGGEALDVSALAPWFADPRGAHVRLVNMYGITETTVHTTVRAVTARTTGDSAASPIGHALGDLRLHLLDPDLARCPVGVPGELYVGGAGLARGYLGRPGLTADRFLPDPSGGGRLYRTGDLCRWTEDGELEYLGRADEQVKIRGFRIELGEIEARLSALDGVTEAVVLARQDTPGERRLVAYLVAAEEAHPVPVLRAWLERTLPGYMVPAAFVFLTALPLTPSGKVDRRALPAPDSARPDLGARLVGARSPVEELLATVWCAVLGLDEVGVYDNFFDLGGDSILSIQIVARAAAAGLRLTPRLVFEHQTIAELAGAARPVSRVDTEQGVVTGTAPLTPIQHWFFARDLPELHHYNQAVQVRVPTDLGTEQVRELVHRLVVQHDALRMRFRRGEDGWFQENLAEENADLLRVADLSADPGGLEAEADRVQASLDPCEGPVFRALLADLGAAGRRLLLVAHHLVIDGVSWRILLDDLEAGYRALRAGEPLPAPPKSTAFLHWARLLRDYAGSPEAAAELPHWKDQVATASRVPADLAGENTVASTATVTRELSAEHTRSLLTDVPSAYRTSINDVLLTALALTLRGRVAARSVTVDLEGHGREDLIEGTDLSRTVGWFTAIYPVSLCTDPALDTGELLKHTKQTLRQIPRNGVGYGILRHLGHPGTDLPDSGGQILFNYLGQFDNVLSADRAFTDADEPRGATQARSGTRTHALELNSSVSGGLFRLTLSYSTGQYRTESAVDIAEDFLAQLRAVITHCVTPGNTGAVPADFPLAGLDQHTLDAILGQYSGGE